MPAESLINHVQDTVVRAGDGLFLGGWTALWVSTALGVTALSRSAEPALAMARRVWAPGLLWAARTDLSVEGGELVDWSQPNIFLCNHSSMFDIPVLFSSLRSNVRFVAKSSLAHVPFLGWYMRATEMIFIDRGNSEEARRSLALAGERIRAGASILAFPEGTRSRDGQIGAFKKGAFILALEAQVPVVPVAIEGAARVLPPGGFRVHKDRLVRVRIGAPIATAGLRYEDRDAFIREVRGAIIALHDRLRASATTAG